MCQQWQSHLINGGFLQVISEHASFLSISVLPSHPPPPPISQLLHNISASKLNVETDFIKRICIIHWSVPYECLHIGQQGVSIRTTHLLDLPFHKTPCTMHCLCVTSSWWADEATMIIHCLLPEASTGLHGRYSMNWKLCLSHDGSLIGNLQQSWATSVQFQYCH